MSTQKLESGKDVEILRNGAICMYHSKGILNEDFVWFSNNKIQCC